MSLSCVNVVKSYPGLAVLRGVNLQVDDSETVAIRGASGTGKSTLLQCLGLLDRADSGTITIGDTRIDQASASTRSRLRARKIGFVFQAFHLLPDFNVLENIVMSARAAGLPLAKAQADALTLLDRVGIADKASQSIGVLSGGERSRVALCRALLTKPSVLLADEPTGNLDPGTASLVLQQMLDLAQANHTSVIIVTHDHHIADRCDRSLVLRDGLLSNA